MHNMLLDSTLPFHSGPGAEGRKTRAGSSLASVFHASGAEVWQSLPWLYLGQPNHKGFFFGARCTLQDAPAWREKCVAPGISPALLAHTVEDLLPTGDICDTLWGVTLQPEWRGMGWAGPMAGGHGGSSEHPPGV